jgi:hypothetical protein
MHTLPGSAACLCWFNCRLWCIAGSLIYCSNELFNIYKRRNHRKESNTDANIVLSEKWIGTEQAAWPEGWYSQGCLNFLNRFSLSSAGILEQSLGARNRVGTELSYSVPSPIVLIFQHIT